jgi:hypothetical protein
MTAKVLPILPALLRRAHLAALDRAVDHVQACLDTPAVWAEASVLYHQPVPDADALGDLLADRNAQPEFLSLLLWDGCPGQPQPVGADLLHNTTDVWQRKVLQALLDTPPRCWVVIKIEAQTVYVRGLGDRRVLRIDEPLLASAVQPGDLWLGRIVTVQGVSMLDAVHAWLPAATLAAMKRVAPHIRALPRAKQLYGWLQVAGRTCQQLAPVAQRTRSRGNHLELVGPGMA